MKTSLISELFAYFLKKWKIICIFGFGGAIIGFIIMLFNKPKFESKLTFALDSSSLTTGMPAGLSGIASSFGLGGATGESLFEGENLIELMKSKKVIQNTLLKKIPYRKRNFIEDYITTYELRESWEEKPELKGLKFELNSLRNKMSYHQDSILNVIYEKLLKKHIKIKQISNKINITTINVKTHSHVFSRYFPEALIEEVTKIYTDTKTKKAKLNYDVLKFQTDSIRRELNNALVGAASSNDQIFGLNPSMNIQRVPSMKRQVDIQANTAILTELVKNLELARVNLLNNTPIIELIDVPRYPIEKIYTRKLIGIAVGGFLGGIIILCYLYFTDNTLKNLFKKQE